MLAATIDFIDELAPGPDPRAGDPRIAIDRPSTLRRQARAPLDVTVRDLSSRGFRFESGADVPVDTIVRVGLCGAGVQDARIVRRDGVDYGCAFLEPLSTARMAIAFGAAEVVRPAFPEAGGAPSVTTEPDKWPSGVRVAFLVGSSVVLWGALLAGAGAIFG